jgi:hypothetical protein
MSRYGQQHASLAYQVCGGSKLARASVGRDELAVGGGPDTLDAAAGAQEKGGRRQCHEGHQECVFDQVLSLIIVPKVAKCSHVRSPVL